MAHAKSRFFFSLSMTHWLAALWMAFLRVYNWRGLVNELIVLSKMLRKLPKHHDLKTLEGNTQWLKNLSSENIEDWKYRFVHSSRLMLVTFAVWEFFVCFQNTVWVVGEFRQLYFFVWNFQFVYFRTAAQLDCIVMLVKRRLLNNA